jgi:hypothetical protein
MRLVNSFDGDICFAVLDTIFASIDHAIRQPCSKIQAAVSTKSKPRNHLAAPTSVLAKPKPRNDFAAPTSVSTKSNYSSQTNIFAALVFF